MSILNKTLTSALALCVVAGSFGQLVKSGNTNNTNSSKVGNSGVGAAADDGSLYLLVVPNLIWGRDDVITDPFDGQKKHCFRPEVINIDHLTIRDVLTATGTTGIDGNLLVQAVRVSKETPYWKCTAFVTGPGSGRNTNFDTGWKYADSSMLDDFLCNIAFGIPFDSKCLGDRCLLFSPPATKYTLYVAYVRRDPKTGRVGAPVVVRYCIQVRIPTREDIACNIEYFMTVAAGVTQKCKITEECAEALLVALSEPDNLTALLEFEFVVAFCAIDFSVLRDAKDADGNWDARFISDYLIDSDEEPIGCLLIEMANAALWF
jgi:hypothetical protein